MCRPCRPAVLALLLAALLLLGSGSAAAPCAASAAATVAAARSALGPFKSWQEAWAALSPYGPSPTNGSAPPTIAACRGLTDVAIRALFTQWKAKYKLNYKPAVDTLRYSYFKSTVQRLVPKLSTCPRTVWVGLTAQADWSPNELILRRKLFEPRLKLKDAVDPTGVPQPISWDWRARNLDKVTPAKDQGRCGACAAFAAIAAIESKLLIQYGKNYSSYPIDLSEQQTIDCATASQGSYHSMGCAGGYLEDPLAYSARHFVTKEPIYPFTSGSSNKAGACNKARTASLGLDDKVQLTGSGFKQLRPWSAAALREAVRVAPVTVGIYVPEGSMFDFYSGGIWPASSCALPKGAPSDKRAMVNHAMVVVGWNMRYKPYYWIVKNTWGPEWGESGFANIEMMPDNTYGTCFMYYYMVAPTPLVPTGLPITPEPAKTSVRLVHPNKSNTTAGRVEVKLNGAWGTVCSRGFNNAAATVVCRQLGRGTIGIAVPNAAFGMGMGLQLWLDEVTCRGDELRLEACAHAGWGWSKCGHMHDVGVVCKKEQPVTARVVNATSVAGRVSGRLELLHKGSWKSACSSGFNNAAATVVCKQLNLGVAGTALANNAYGRGAGRARLASIKCQGTEAKWEACTAAVWADSTCGVQGDVGISCTRTAPTVRLVDGDIASNPRAAQGRLEVQLPNGKWSTVCDDDFSDASATVVCRQLGLSSTGYAVPNAIYGEGIGPIAWDGVACTGRETTIQQCPRSSTVDCTHSEDVGVVCGSGNEPRVQPSVRLRLADGSGMSGRLEVQYNGVWGTVCRDVFSTDAATVACKQLGLLGPGAILPVGFVKPGKGPILLDDVYCFSDEKQLQDCLHAPWGKHNCQHSQDVAIACGFINQFRLANGTRRMGRLEVQGPDGRWGTVCRRGFDNVAAAIVCKQLGLPLPGRAIAGPNGAGVFGRGSGPIWMDEISCWRNESRLEQCQFAGWGKSACDHSQDVGVACGSQVKFRLAGGPSAASGRLEVALDGVWGKVAMPGTSWSFYATGDNLALDLICRELNLPTPGYLLPHGTFGDTPGPIWIGEVRCNYGDATRLLERCEVTWGTGKFPHWNGDLYYNSPTPKYNFRPIAIACGGPPVGLRLVNGTSSNNGRLEVNFLGRWGTVCIPDASFNDATATNICRLMGRPTPGRAVQGSYWGAGNGLVWLDRLWCPYYPAASLLDCVGRNWGMPDSRCTPGMMAGIVCGAEPTQIRLANPTANGLGGRLELLFDGQWGTVCCDYCFGGDRTTRSGTASALCSQLGLGGIGRFVDASTFGPGSGPVHLMLDEIGDCYPPYHIDNCGHAALGYTRCGHDTDLGLLCQATLEPPRLTGGVPWRSGRLELKLNGEWGSVCNMEMRVFDGPSGFTYQLSSFSDRSAQTACRQLGLPLPGRVLPRGQFGPGPARTWLHGAGCRGFEAELEDCAFGAWGNVPWRLDFLFPDARAYTVTFKCAPQDAVAIECGFVPPAVELRLAGGVPGKSGRLEIKYNGVWGTVCARYQGVFTDAAATVACKQMGLKGPGIVSTFAKSCYGEGKGPVWLMDVACTGTEPGLQYCSHDGWGVTTDEWGFDACGGHSSDIGIKCNWKPTDPMC